MIQLPRHLLGVASGAGLAFCLWLSVAGSRPEDGGGAFRLAARPLDLTSADLLGTMRNDPGHLELSGLRSAQAAVPLKPGDTLELTLTVPEGASIMLRQGHEMGGMAPVGAPPGPPPKGGPGKPTGGGPPPVAGPGLVFDRGSATQLRGVGGLTCSPLALPAEAITASLAVGSTGVNVQVGAATSQCTGARLLGPWQLKSGVAGVRVRAATLSRSGGGAALDFAGGPPWATWPAAFGFAGVGAALGGLASRKWGPHRAWAPLALAPLIAAVPLARWLESIRMLSVPEASVPLGVAIVVTALVGGPSWARERSLRSTLLLSLLPAVGVAAAIPWVPAAKAWSLLALSFLPWMWLCWANTHRVRSVALASWAAVIAIVWLGESGVRLTALNSTWIRTAGYERAATEFAELLELKRHRAYPSEGFPVQPPVPRPGIRRIVAFGGSSTGGAYQMDDINLFWPKKLEEQLPGWEVVNQGVGGWNTLHVRLYAESQLERLDPQLLVLYVGHNDVFTRGAASHKALLGRYLQPAGGTVVAVGDWLHRSRLFVGFKFLLLSWRGDAAVAVPLSDARENITAILDLAKARGTHVLLMPEGLSPDAVPMRPYAALLADLATRSGERAFDAAAKFASEADPDDFLDDCHLTVGGHVRLAGWVKTELEAAGWLGG